MTTRKKTSKAKRTTATSKVAPKRKKATTPKKKTTTKKQHTHKSEELDGVKRAGIKKEIRLLKSTLTKLEHKIG